jgi:hypothetical protein
MAHLRDALRIVTRRVRFCHGRGPNDGPLSGALLARIRTITEWYGEIPSSHFGCTIYHLW